MRIRSRFCLLILSSFLALAAHPASAQLVNINALVSGAHPTGTDWYAPFGAVSVSLAAGTYDFTLTNPQLTPGALYTAWSYNTPWATTYLVFDSTNLNQQLFKGAVSSQGYPTAQIAFDTTVGQGNAVTTWTFQNQVTLLFTLSDFLLQDNSGGVSVDVTPHIVAPPEPPPVGAVPEPSTYGVGAACVLLGISFMRRRLKDRRSAQIAS